MCILNLNLQNLDNEDLWLEPFEFKVVYGGNIDNDKFEVLTLLALWSW
jgi:hypothetical protein